MTNTAHKHTRYILKCDSSLRRLQLSKQGGGGGGGGAIIVWSGYGIILLHELTVGH